MRYILMYTYFICIVADFFYCGYECILSEEGSEEGLSVFPN